jgi:PKHD-type hydroxylase
MSNYIFAPTPMFHRESFATWNNVFSDEELVLLDKMATDRGLGQATVGDNEGENDPTVRISNVAWIDLREDSRWLYDRLSYVANQLNGQFFQFDLYGFNEDMQYTVYDGEKQGHYTWHLDDSGKNTQRGPRKLSLVIQLSDPSEYEGGELQLKVGPDPTVVDKAKGLVAAFPSYTLHRATPVTKGIRKTLVVWITGPAFR